MANSLPSWRHLGKCACVCSCCRAVISCCKAHHSHAIHCMYTLCMYTLVFVAVYIMVAHSVIATNSKSPCSIYQHAVELLLQPCTLSHLCGVGHRYAAVSWSLGILVSCKHVIHCKLDRQLCAQATFLLVMPTPNNASAERPSSSVG